MHLNLFVATCTLIVVASASLEPNASISNNEKGIRGAIQFLRGPVFTPIRNVQPAGPLTPMLAHVLALARCNKPLPTSVPIPPALLKLSSQHSGDPVSLAYTFIQWAEEELRQHFGDDVWRINDLADAKDDIQSWKEEDLSFFFGLKMKPRPTTRTMVIKIPAVPPGIPEQLSWQERTFTLVSTLRSEMNDNMLLVYRTGEKYAHLNLSYFGRFRPFILCLAHVFPLNGAYGDNSLTSVMSAIHTEKVINDSTALGLEMDLASITWKYPIHIGDVFGALVELLPKGYAQDPQLTSTICSRSSCRVPYCEFQTFSADKHDPFLKLHLGDDPLGRSQEKSLESLIYSYYSEATLTRATCCQCGLNAVHVWGTVVKQPAQQLLVIEIVALKDERLQVQIPVQDFKIFEREYSKLAAFLEYVDSGEVVTWLGIEDGKWIRIGATGPTESDPTKILSGESENSKAYLLFYLR